MSRYRFLLCIVCEYHFINTAASIRPFYRVHIVA